MKLPDFDPDSVPLSEVPTAIVVVNSWHVRLENRLKQSQVKPRLEEEDQLLTTAEAAAKLRRSRTWIYRRARTLPFARELDNHSWAFSKKGIEKWLAGR